MSVAFVSVLFYWLEKHSLVSMVALMGLFFLIGGDLLGNGLNVPNGYTLVVAGATTTVTQTFTSYTQANNGWILGVGWLFIFGGFYYMVQVLLFAVTFMGGSIPDFNNKKSFLK